MALRNAKKYENSLKKMIEADKQSVINSGNEIMALPLKKRMSKLQAQQIAESLEENQYNVSRTASQLGISRQNLQYLIKKLNLKYQKNSDDL